MSIGVVYQCGPKVVATYKALEQLRVFYPNIPICIYEDGTDNLKEIANRFSCDYRKIEKKQGLDEGLHGRLFVEKGSQIAWLGRIYSACKTTLKECQWIIHYEDDVWCRRKIVHFPDKDICGATGPRYTNKLYDYLKSKFGVKDDSRGVWSVLGSLETYGACGGTIFNKEKFEYAFERINSVPWDLIYELDDRPIEWCDATLSFLFQFFGFSYGRWRDWANYNSKGLGNHWDKTGWTAPMSEQEDAAFIHGFKHFYNYTPNEFDLAIKKQV